MLTKMLYILCKFITHQHLDSNLYLKNKLFLNENIISELSNKIYFRHQWEKDFNYSYKLKNFSFTYKLLEQVSSAIKIQLSIKKYFYLTNSKSIISGSLEDYMIISELSNKKNLKIIALISKEENPNLYSLLKNVDLNLYNKFNFENNFWSDKLLLPNSIYDNFFKNMRLSNISSSFNVEEACKYAETFALTPNPEYKSYDNIGGDCTNFISQILSYGGIKKNSVWKPYTHSWIRVQELYSYLINNNIAQNIKFSGNLSKGCLIQFYTPQKGYFFHSGFITYKLEADYLYCCHSYNKLNYPLSAIYPIIYPTIRSLILL